MKFRHLVTGTLIPEYLPVKISAFLVCLSNPNLILLLLPTTNFPLPQPSTLQNSSTEPRTNMKLREFDESLPTAPTRTNNSPSKTRVATRLLQRLNLSVVDEKSTNWTTESTAYNLRVPVVPSIVVYAHTARQIQDVVSVGVTADLKVSARCGGHSYASLGHGGENDHLIVDLTHMNSVVVDPTTHIATVGAGARLGHVANELYSQGGRAISHGSCPGVGISGHILHGGYGWASHNKGLALDWMLGANVVLANGTEVHCSKTDNPDLFWALRGAGSNFGIVTSYELSTFPAPSTSTPFKIPLGWQTEDQKTKGVKALVDFARSAPAELNMRCECVLCNSLQAQPFLSTCCCSCSNFAAKWIWLTY